MASSDDLDFDVMIIGGRARNREKAREALESAPLVGGQVDGKLNQKAFAEVKRLLQMVPQGTQAPSCPRSSTEGTASGWLLHQGKMRGLWKKAWFVLKPPYLYQYPSDTSDMTRPKNTVYVAYAMSDKISLEDLEHEVDDAQVLQELEERACSLRINVYTGTKTKVLTATSEGTMETWLKALEESVASHTAGSLLDGKREAAQQLGPLLTSQMLYELDLTRALTQSLNSSGLLAHDADPMFSKQKAKGGKLWLLKHGRSLSHQVSEEFLYFCLVGDFLYYYKEVVPVDEFYEVEECVFFQGQGVDLEEQNAQAASKLSESGYKYKGFINLKLAKVGMAPKEVLNDHRRNNSIMITTPLRTFVLVAMHELSSEDWMMQIQAAQQGVPLKSRKAKMNLIDVHNDAVADKIVSAPQTLTLDECLGHQVTCHYFSKFVTPKDGALGPALLIFKEFAKLERLTIHDLIVQKAIKIRDKQFKEATCLDDATRAAMDEQFRDEEFTTPNCFQPVKEALRALSEKHFEAFKASAVFGELRKTAGPKYLEITRDDDSKFLQFVVLDGELIVGRGDPRDDGRSYLQLWRDGDDSRISREHCKLDVGKIACLVTDLGSSNGTRYTPGAAGRIIKLDHLPPGGALYLGSYVLAYKLGSPPKGASLTAKKIGKGMFGMMKKKG